MESVRHAIKKTYYSLDNIFTDREAWALFRWSAWAETIGWVMLLTGILFQVTKWPGDSWVLPIGASLHGMAVIGYMGIVLFTHRSLKWGIKRFIIAELINAIPFGALAFEQYIARERRS